MGRLSTLTPRAPAGTVESSVRVTLPTSTTLLPPALQSGQPPIRVSRSLLLLPSLPPASPSPSASAPLILSLSLPVCLLPDLLLVETKLQQVRHRDACPPAPNIWRSPRGRTMAEEEGGGARVPLRPDCELRVSPEESPFSLLCRHRSSTTTASTRTRGRGRETTPMGGSRRELVTV
eukprot:750923-Hanusia_phi.AAC.1